MCWHSTGYVLALSVAIVLFLGCNSGATLPPDTTSPDTASPDVGVPAIPLLDVLFVVDDSPGNCQEQRSLAKNFGSFLATLKEFGPVDIRVAVTTTNVCGFRSCWGCPSGECGTHVGEHVCFCSSDDDCDGSECRVIAGKGVCLAAGAVRGRFVYQPAKSLPPECVEKLWIPCLKDDDCLDSPLLPAPGNWRCEGKPIQHTYTCDKPAKWGTDPYPGEILYTINSQCRFHCENDNDCITAFGNPRYYCLYPGGDKAHAGCMLPPDTSACPENGPVVLDSSSLDEYVNLWKTGSWQGLPEWDSLNVEQVQDAVFAYLFNCMASVGAAQNICGSQEQGLMAAMLALDPEGENAEQAQAFHRAEAVLLVVIDSNEDDCSSEEGIPAIEGSQCPCKADSDGCTADGRCDPTKPGPLIPVSTFVEQLSQLKPDPEQVFFAAFVGGVSPGSFISPGQDAQAIMDRFYECKCDAGMYAPFTSSCLSLRNGKSDLGARYMAVATALGGISWNLCTDPGLKPALEQVAVEVIDRFQRLNK